MPNTQESYQLMQRQIDTMGSGHCVMIKLVNYTELKALYEPVYSIVDDLNKIVRKICSEMMIDIYTQIEHNRIMLLLPKMDKQYLKRLVYSVYEASQLYTNDEHASVYMQCKISSIDFSPTHRVADYIFRVLLGLFASDTGNGFYREYNSKLHDLDYVRTANIRLNHFRKALLAKEVTFAYQPIIDRKTGYTHYYECLLRVPDFLGNPVSIGPIVKEAEDKGLINVIDQIVLKMAVQELIKAPDITLSVNISSLGIVDEYLLDVAEELLREYNVADRLILEITETTLNEDYEKTKNFIDRLHAFGCKFALDDFGAGFTSFKQLKNLPIDIIKIDGSYVRNVLSDWHSKYFIERLVKISEELGTKTVAEFVENGEIAKFLIDIKVDGMQGNFFSPATNKRL